LHRFLASEPIFVLIDSMHLRHRKFHRNRNTRPITGEGGFTLLELLISTTLIAVLVVILSLALRTGIQAWSRGKEANLQNMPIAAIEGLLSRQLRSAVIRNPMDPTSFAFFKGDETQIAFLTNYTPLGNLAGGSFLVCYRYDAATKSLIFAQKIITRRDAFPQAIPEEFTTQTGSKDMERQLKDGWEVEVVSDVPEVRFAFLSPASVSKRPDEWDNKWEATYNMPVAVAVFWGEEANMSIFYTTQFITRSIS